MINLNEGIPVTTLQEMTIQSMGAETRLINLYIDMINVIRDRNFVGTDSRCKPESYDKISLEISNSRRTVANAIKKAKDNGNIDQLKKVAFKLLKAGI